MVNQIPENLKYEIRCWGREGVLYTNCLVENLHDATLIYKMYTEVAQYRGVQVWHNGENITDTIAKAKLVIMRH